DPTPTTTDSGTDSEGETVDPSLPTTDGTTAEPPATTTTTDPGTTPEDTTTTEGVETTEGEDTTTTSGDPVDPVDPDLCPLAQMHRPCDPNSDDPLHAIGLNCTSLGGQ